MEKIYMKIEIAFILTIASTIVPAQAQNYSDPFQNRVIVKQYGIDQLRQIQDEIPHRLNKIIYYYTQSFSAKVPGCPSCQVNYDSLFNIRMFGIMEYEHLRLANTEYSFTDELSGLSVTLFSRQIIDDHLAALKSNSDDNFSGNTHNFPKYITAINEEIDYRTYKAAVHQWALANTDLYRQLSNSDKVIKISYSELKTLPEDKKQALLAHKEGYIIID